MTIVATGVSRPEAWEYLEGLGLSPGAVADPEVSTHGSDAFHGVQEARADWGMHRLELNGKFALRQATEVFGRAMTVTSVISSDGTLTTDDRGGTRIEAYRKFPFATCDRGPEGTGCEWAPFDAAKDDHGLIVEFVRDQEGLPNGIRFGETLLLRYHFTPPLPERRGLGRLSDRWRPPSSWELIDLRSAEIVVDSAEVGRVAARRPHLSVFFAGIGEVLRFEGGQPFAVVPGKSGLYALSPLDKAADVWRIVHASGDMSRDYRFRVDYTDDLVRVEFKAGDYGERSIVVEAPRSRGSAAPVAFVHPGAEMLTEAMRSGVRLRTAGAVDTWLHSTFEKERLPIVLEPFHLRGIRMESGVVPEAASAEQDLDFGPADGCEETEQAILCLGGDSYVVGEESADPW